jgi:hypothetical protein
LADHGASLVDGLQRYRDDVRRASAMLHIAQPDLTASDTLPGAETRARRLLWPFVIAIWMSVILWLSIAVAITMLA